MTTLTLLPCQDSDDFGKNSVEFSTLKKSPESVGQHHQETCPPFCTCACCSVSRYCNAAQELNFVVKELAVAFVPYKMPSIKEQFIEIYQPPQIA